MKIRSVAVSLVLFVFAALGAWGQSTATLTGVVTDPTGAVVPNAQVKIHSLATGGDRNLVTDSAGIYVAPSLQPGDYRVGGDGGGLQRVQGGEGDAGGGSACDGEHAPGAGLGRGDGAGGEHG